MSENVVTVCWWCPSLFPLLLLPCCWTCILVLHTVMFCLSSGKCAALSTRSQHTVSLVSVSLAHINMPLLLVASLLSLLPSSPAIPLAAARFLFSSNVLLAFVVSKCCQLSRLSPGPWPSYSPCPPPVSLFLLSSFSLFFDLFCHRHSALSSSVISWLPMNLFKSTVLFHSTLLFFAPGPK